jgi:hypothetical protein
VRFHWLKATGPWLLLFLCVLVPLYTISAVFAIRTGVFNLADRTISGDEYKAVWAFIASGFATSVTIVGLLFTRAHNKRVADQLVLDTAIKGLDLLVVEGGQYAPAGRIAGALATLVHLGHPGIAMRSLHAVWNEGAVDAPTACWLISEVFRTGSKESMVEASVLLQEHASELTAGRNQQGQFYWPDALYDEWPLHIPYEARFNNFASLLDLLLSRDKDWWGMQLHWALTTMYLVLRDDRDFNEEAAIVIRAIMVHASREDKKLLYQVKSQSITFEAIREAAMRVPETSLYPEMKPRLEALQKWASSTGDFEARSNVAKNRTVRRRRPRTAAAGGRPQGRP